MTSQLGCVVTTTTVKDILAEKELSLGRFDDNKGFVTLVNPPEEDMVKIQRGLEDHNRKYPNGELDIPSPDISLVLKNKEGTIIGGVITSMVSRVMHLEVLWVDRTYRGRGYGKDLVLQAERIGAEKGYTASQTWSFSFQAPGFYQSIGYKVLGIFDGYTDGITEYVLMKKLGIGQHVHGEQSSANKDGYTITEDSSEEAMEILYDGLHEYVSEHVGELRRRNPEISIRLAVKKDGQVIGGLTGFTTLKAMYIEVLWIDERYRGQGYGRELVKAAEDIAREKGCISGIIFALSFQSPGFFEKLGYGVFGVSDAYPDPLKQYFLKKKL
ncbi:MAG: GNAT family N-acetyltransferase [Candidatus Odinarchaeota archaeon]